MKNVEKITKAQKYAMIEKILNEVEHEDAPMLIEFVQAEANALARKASKAKEKAEEKKTELDELAIAVLNVLTAEPQTRDVICDAVVADYPEATVAKVGARLTKLFDLGYAERSEVSATSASGKKTTRKVYTAATAEAEVAED